MSEWQPIETAPKDGTIIQLYRPPAIGGTWQTRVTAFWHVSEGHGAWVWPDSDFINIEDEDRDWLDQGDFYEDAKHFTHWMPLPGPPSEAA